MFGFRLALVTLVLFGAALAADDVHIIHLQAEPIDLDFSEIKDGGVNKVLPKAYHEVHYGEKLAHEVELQGAPIDFDFEDVIPMNMQKLAPQTFQELQKRTATSTDETIELQEQAIPFDLDFEFREKRAADEPEAETIQLQEQAIPFELDFEIREKRDADSEVVQLQEQSIPFDLDFDIRNKREAQDEKVELQEQSIPFDLDFLFTHDKREVFEYVPEEVGGDRFSKRGQPAPILGGEGLSKRGDYEYIPGDAGLSKRGDYEYIPGDAGLSKRGDYEYIPGDAGLSKRDNGMTLARLFNEKRHVKRGQSWSLDNPAFEECLSNFGTYWECSQQHLN